ncbi:MAG: hypothetical protein RL230_691 [Pseudomonadota bacterium]
MILKASQRSGAKQLDTHLLRTDENEHVELHEISGVVSETLQGAMNEAYALSKGTKCKQFCFQFRLVRLRMKVCGSRCLRRQSTTLKSGSA